MNKISDESDARIKKTIQKALKKYHKSWKESSEDPYIKFLLDDDAVTQITNTIDELTDI